MLRNKSFLGFFGDLRKLCENGHLGEALGAVESMEHQGLCVPPNLYHCLLQGCVKKRDLIVGRHVFSLITRNGFASNASFGAVLIRMFASCGSLQEAQWVFTRLPHPNLFTWTAIISAHAKLGQGEQAIELYHRMQQSELELDQHVFVAILKACTTTLCVTQGMLVHGHIIENGLEADTFVGNSLIDMYTKCGNLKDGGKVFVSLPNPSVVTWTIIIVGFVEHGHGWEAVQLFWKVQLKAIIEPDSVIFVNILKACSILVAPDQGKLIHAKVIEESHETAISVSNALIDMYAKCGSLEDARQIFDRIGERSTVTWNTMIAAYSQQKGHDQEAFYLFQQMSKGGLQPTNLTWNSMIAGLVQQGQGQKALQLFQEMQEAGIEPDDAIFVSVLKGCLSIAAIQLGWLVHAHIVETCHELEMTVENTLIDMYARCGSFQDACSVFNRSSKQSVVTWTAMISGYLQGQRYEEALLLFEQMQDMRVEPNYVTFLSMLKGCSDQASLEWGRVIHSHIIRFSFEMDAFVSNSLIDMYAKCGILEDACSIFQGMPKENVVTWTAMIAGYAQNGYVLQAYTLFQEMQHDGVQSNIVTWNVMLAGFAEHGHSEEALQIFQKMQKKGMEPDDMTFVSVLKACGSLALANQGRLIHSLVIENGFECDIYVGNTLVDMYAKCGSLMHARRVFDALPKQDVVTWNAMIARYSQYEDAQEAFSLFEKLEQEGMWPDQATFASTLSVCSSMLALSQGKLIHALMVESNFTSDVVAINALIDMYAKCGSVDDACRVFEKTHNRDVVTWSAMVSGYTQQSKFKSAMDIFNKMQLEGLKPDDVTFVSLLSACSQMGFVHEGCQAFLAMSEDHGLTPKLDHFNCLVALIGNAGCWSEAEDLLQTMPFPPDIIGWTSLLCHCRSHGNVDLGERCFEQVISMDHRDAAGPQLMSSIYADAGMWSNANQVGDWRRFSNSWKKPGKAFIEVDDVAHGFVVGDKTHLQSDAVYAKLQNLSMQLKEEGYTPQSYLAVQPIPDENVSVLP